MAKKPGTPFTGASPAKIDLIGTISASLMTIGAPYTVAWAKYFCPQAVSLVGGVIFGLSLIAASFGTALWHFQVTQGLLLGIGTCLSFVVPVTVAPSWFANHRGLAMGIILSGTGIGGLVWAPALQACVDGIGFRNSLRLTGALSFALISTASGAMAWEPSTKARIETENSARARRIDSLLRVPLVDFRIAKTKRFFAQALGAMFQSAAYYIPVFFFASYARSLGYSDTAGANFVAISNACNAIGKIAIGYVADRAGRLNALFLTTLLSAVFTIGFWLPSTCGKESADSKGLFIAFTILYGTFSSAYVSLFPISLVELFGVQNFASVNGVLYMMRGIATMIGTPVGGAFIRGTGNTSQPQDFFGMSLLVSCLLFAATAAVLWVRLEVFIGANGFSGGKWRQ
ncbi:major facilitator superfamily domain-containing protein [Penicillium daleae]|uniref:Major facilitator superfamily domain-containing protein n=1 Tax=Penicillium daleae TaxID=63821 RepID=A0AAD6C9A9_9EURO|nr:major facilitator superfamily domain-containing protein [Penicillium daleae]KAJ5455502.1 major facilitator superfamily domain-containing protein [Penicillium daleae]